MVIIKRFWTSGRVNRDGTVVVVPRRRDEGGPEANIANHPTIKSLKPFSRNDSTEPRITLISQRRLGDTAPRQMFSEVWWSFGAKAPRHYSVNPRSSGVVK